MLEDVEIIDNRNPYVNMLYSWIAQQSCGLVIQVHIEVRLLLNHSCYSNLALVFPDNFKITGLLSLFMAAERERERILLHNSLNIALK